MSHIPVLVEEVVNYLNGKNGGKFVDATVGSAGHTKAILESNPSNEVLGIDWDQENIEKISIPRVRLVWGNYKYIDKILDEVGWDKVDGILLDLGFSSMQVDAVERGFSFAQDANLDMRYDKSSDDTAEKVVNEYHPKDLERVLSEFGEEKFSRRIVQKIVEARQKGRIKTTTQLAQIIRSAIPLPVRFRAEDSMRRVFQAIRIEVNSELDNLKGALPKMLKQLNPGGRLVVISFHSLEDRIVKEFFASEAKDCICPPDFPTCVCGKTSTMRILTRKPVTASEAELKLNPRSKSAKLRAAEKK